MKTDVRFVINRRLQNGVYLSLREGKAGRSWEQIVGYTVDELMAHLRRQLPAGCTDADLATGRVHIDHIVPKSSFDVATEQGVRAAWCLSNLRPVPAQVNLRKGARREFLL